MKKQLIAAVAAASMLGFGGFAVAGEADADRTIVLSDVSMDDVTAAGKKKKRRGGGSFYRLYGNTADAEAGASALGFGTRTFSDTYTNTTPISSLSISRSSSSTAPAIKPRRRGRP